jgi:ribosome-associated protein
MKTKPRKSAPAAPRAKAAPRTKAAPRAKAAPRTPASPTQKLLKLIVQALDAKKAEDLRVLDVSEQSSITDYLVLANGNSDPHLRALRVELEKVIDAEKVRILGMDTTKESGWMVIDAFDVMVHLFTPENRDKYRMELLWKDATPIALSKLLK